MGKTVAEKILSAHCKKDVRAGDYALCDVDFSLGQDGTSALIIDALKKLNAKKLALNKKFCMIIDHSAPSPNIGVSAIHKKMRVFADENKLKLYDIGCGVCHQVMLESGNVLPGSLIVGADSHTCTYGAVGSLATGFGSTDLAITLASGKNWFKVPETIKIVLEGALQKGVYSKDIILHIIGDLGSDGATYNSVEFTGPVISSLSIDARFTISNMAVEMGAKCGIMYPDKKVIEWLKKRNKIIKNPGIAYPDKDAVYKYVKKYDVTKIKPKVAMPHTVDNVTDAAKLKSIKINQAYIGTCTNGRLEDLKVAANIVKGKRVAKDIRFLVAPASKDIYLEAIKRGIIETLINSGACILAPGCGPCVGTHNGVPADNEVVVSTANRNFKGRMGNPKAFIYLASPATVAASALTGRITLPCKFV